MPPLTPRNTNASLASSNAKKRKQAPEDSNDGDDMKFDDKKFELLSTMDPIEEFRLSITHIDIGVGINNWNKLSASDLQLRDTFRALSAGQKGIYFRSVGLVRAVADRVGIENFDQVDQLYICKRYQCYENAQNLVQSRRRHQSAENILVPNC